MDILQSTLAGLLLRVFEIILIDSCTQLPTAMFQRMLRYPIF